MKWINKARPVNTVYNYCHASQLCEFRNMLIVATVFCIIYFAEPLPLCYLSRWQSVGHRCCYSRWRCCRCWPFHYCCCHCCHCDYCFARHPTKEPGQPLPIPSSSWPPRPPAVADSPGRWPAPFRPRRWALPCAWQCRFPPRRRAAWMQRPVSERYKI